MRGSRFAFVWAFEREASRTCGQYRPVLRPLKAVPAPPAAGETLAWRAASRRFIVTGSDRPKLLEFAEEIFDEMARLVHLLVKGALDFATTLGRDHQQSIGLHLRQQRIGAL